MATTKIKTPHTDRITEPFYALATDIGFAEALAVTGPLTRAAIALAAFHGQVCNGGFSQWAGNGYAELDNEPLRRALAEMEGPAASAALELIDEFDGMGEEPHDEEDYAEWLAEQDELCDRYYAISDAFQAEVDRYLAALEQRIGPNRLP